MPATAARWVIEGVNKGRSLPLDELVPAYWAEMGWDSQTGAPGVEALQALGISTEQQLSKI